MDEPTMKQELTGYIRYGYWYNRYHARFYSRVGKCITFFQLLSSTSVVASTLKENPDVAIASAICIAALGVLNEVVGFSKKAAEHTLAASQYNDLNNDLGHMKIPAAKNVLTRLQNRWPDGFDAIDELAHNTVCDLHGDSGNKLTLTFKAKLVQLIV